MRSLLAAVLLLGVYLGCADPEVATVSRVHTGEATTTAMTVDPDFPPTMHELSFDSQGSRLNGLIYTASGRGPHPVVVLLHGYPGNERNLDLAQRLRAGGANVVYFNYRGSWGSGGTFSMLNAVEDAKAVVAFLRSDEAVDAYRNDPDRVALVGHSFGGMIGVLATAESADLDCLVFLAGANFGPWGRAAARDDGVRRALVTGLGSAMDADSGPLRAAPERLVDELVAGAERFDITAHASELASRQLLLVGGTRDQVLPMEQHHRPFADALEEAGASGVTELVYDDDHYFSAHRSQLGAQVSDWLWSRCWADSEEE